MRSAARRYARTLQVAAPARSSSAAYASRVRAISALFTGLVSPRGDRRDPVCRREGRRASMPRAECGARSRGRCSRTSSPRASRWDEIRVVTPDDEGAAAAAEAGADVVSDPGGGQGSAVQAGARKASSPAASSSSTPTFRASCRTTCARCSPRRRRLPGARRGARRDDERAQPPAAEAFAPLYGPEQRRPLPGACRVARGGGRVGRAAEPRGRRRHDGRPDSDSSCAPARARRRAWRSSSGASA